MESIAVPKAGLVQKNNLFGLIIFVLELSGEDVRNFCFRLHCMAYNSSFVFLSGRLVYEVAVHLLSH